VIVIALSIQPIEVPPIGTAVYAWVVSIFK
jgi:hypothetical protein